MGCGREGWKVVRTFFSDLPPPLPSSSSPELVARLWRGKQAAGKAIRRGDGQVEGWSQESSAESPPACPQEALDSTIGFVFFWRNFWPNLQFWHFLGEASHRTYDIFSSCFAVSTRYSWSESCAYTATAAIGFTLTSLPILSHAENDMSLLRLPWDQEP